ncbi:MAG TPA: hypothetical protein O0X01_01470, partial [Methanocorpusculum sp.]|nr:hypothetical protein [Methanocorpusculum sp.]
PADRLRRIARRLEKCYRKNRRAGFSFNLLLFLYNRKNNQTIEKPARGFFSQHFSREGAILRRRSAGAEHPNVRKMRFAFIRGGVQAKGLRAASSGQSPLGLIRVSFIHLSTPYHLSPKLDPHQHRVSPNKK